MYHFGIGFLSAIPSGANPTPIQFGLVKDISLDVSIKMVKERGQYQHVIAVGRGETDITGKAGSVSIFGGALGQIMGVTPTTGSTLGVPGEVGTIPAPSGPYTITVTNSATFSVDYGVLNLTTGLFMTRVASGPTTGQYSVSAGVYTFAAADASNKVSIAYSYTAAAAGKTTPVTNTVMTINTGIAMVAYGPVYGGKCFGLKLYSTHWPKLSFALKPSDFTMQNVEFFAAEDGTTGRNVIDIYTAE